jgi:hypothetical protein
MPSRWPERLGKAETLKFLHPADHGGASVLACPCVGPFGRAWAKVDNAVMLDGLAGERTIELGPTIGFDLDIKIATDLQIASRPKLERDQMRRAGT